MNRVIKFRAWDKRFKKMDFGAGALLLRLNTKDFSKPMQFTGLLDKNGKEIYEGDLLKAIGTTDDRAYEVAWHKEGKWIFKNDSTELYYPIGIYLKKLKGSPKVLEIIGNIYENPELL